MSVFKGTTQETADIGQQAGENLADHLTDRVEQDSPGAFRKLLDVLAEYRISGSFSIGMEKKQ